MKYINLFGLIFTFVLAFATSASAQNAIPIGPRPQIAPRCTAVSSVYIRNLKYDDYTRYSRLSTKTVGLGGYVQISTQCMPFDGQITVTLQDVNRPVNASGVTAFRLTNISRSGGVVTVQMPTHASFRNRTFHVGLFVYGQPWKTANPGAITIQ